MKLCAVRFDGDLSGRLEEQSFTLYDVLSIFQVRRSYYEVTLTPDALQRLKKEYDVDVDYDPFKSKEGGVNVQEIVTAKRNATRGFEIRRDECLQPAQSLYDHYMKGAPALWFVPGAAAGA